MGASRRSAKNLYGETPSEVASGADTHEMSSSQPPQRHLATSPFAPKPERPIEVFSCDDLVQHDSYGMGRVVHTDAAAVMVDFRDQTVRIPSPFAKMTKL